MNDTQLSATDRIEAVLYQYVNLYERWSEDRQMFAKKGADISNLIETIKEEVRRLELIDESVKDSLEKQLKVVVGELKIALVEMTTDEAKKELWEAGQQLKNIVSKVDLTLRQSMWEVTKSRWQWFGITMLASVSSAVLSSAIFIWWVLSHNFR